MSNHQLGLHEVSEEWTLTSNKDVSWQHASCDLQARSATARTMTDEDSEFGSRLSHPQV